jgi:hypothetical protein
MTTLLRLPPLGDASSNPAASLDGDSGPGAWTWAGGFGQNAVVEVAPPLAGAHTLLPTPTPATLERLALDTAHAVDVLLPGARAAGSRDVRASASSAAGARRPIYALLLDRGVPLSSSSA